MNPPLNVCALGNMRSKTILAQHQRARYKSTCNNSVVACVCEQWRFFFCVLEKGCRFLVPRVSFVCLHVVKNQMLKSVTVQLASLSLICNCNTSSTSTRILCKNKMCQPPNVFGYEPPMYSATNPRFVRCTEKPTASTRWYSSRARREPAS
jgi:hypothetical protein